MYPTMTAGPSCEISSTGGSKTEFPPEGCTLKKSRGGSQLTTLGKIFLLLLFLMAAALVGVIVVLIIQMKKDDKEIIKIDGANRDANVCTSIECVTAAASIEDSLDRSVNPCDDFFLFACGGSLKKRMTPGGPFKDAGEKVNLVVRNLLEANISPTDPGYIRKAKTYYKICMNYDRINKLGVRPLIQFITNEFGEWPLTTLNWDERSFDFTETIRKINAIIVSPIFAFYVGTNDRNSSQRILTIDQGGLFQNRKYFLAPRNSKELLGYETIIYSHGELFGFANPSTARQEVKAIVDFEIQLANIMVPMEDRRDSNKLYNPMTLREVQNNYGGILDWKRLVYGILNSPGIGVTDITDNEIIINKSPTFFQRLVTVVRDTPKRTVMNYLMWMVIRFHGYTQGDSIMDIYKAYNKAVSGVVPDDLPRSGTCFIHTTTFMGEAVGKLYIKNSFGAETKTMISEIVKDIQQSFDELLMENDWMDEHTKKVAEEKNRFILSTIGYPEELNNETYLMKTYENFTFQRQDTFLDVNVIARRDGYKQGMKILRKPVDLKKAVFLPTDIDAYYQRNKNQIKFPAGIFQPPFFKKTFPKSLNYGAIGSIIGHEITHAFDDAGRQFDKDGNLRQWWSKEAVDKFKAASQCMIDQYSNYTVERLNMKLNGIITLGENIADNGGLKQAFHAYRRWVKRRGKEEDVLPGLNYSNDQLYFISLAQTRCTVRTDTQIINIIQSNEHSIERFRVIGTVQNSEDFSRVFQCPKTSKMNPQKKCSVW